LVVIEPKAERWPVLEQIVERHAGNGADDDAIARASIEILTIWKDHASKAREQGFPLGYLAGDYHMIRREIDSRRKLRRAIVAEEPIAPKQSPAEVAAATREMRARLRETGAAAARPSFGGAP
jgi:hypothetical protein